MNAIVKFILVGLGGAAVGGGASFFVTKAVVTKKCNQNKEEELKAQREHYESVIAELESANKDTADIINSVVSTANSTVISEKEKESSDDSEDVPQSQEAE